jgi:predicted flap endonuclease-1-like 5' DNA nuclease
MTLDRTTLMLILVIVVGLAVMAIGFMVQRKGRRQVTRADDGASPYVASQERPYMAPPAAAGPQHDGVADEVAAAATDVAGQVLGVEVRPAGAGPADDLQRLKGVGPKFALRLNELGVTSFDQLAGLNANEAAHLDERMGPFQGRLARDRVIEQADYLARGDTDGFEEKFGKLTP